ncbi:MAG TPA: response regulator [Deltaproteobacteria bacterium]|nr:response regulator [Deltaproteobacteria bacterium]HPR55438.1 response regulator [Deltaproteobacteria bacterium]HXK47994.1 response regulator [Deltaproteobacteria bacterium]
MGQAISKIIDTDDLLNTVMVLLEKHLDFQHGMVLLANHENTRLIYRAGFGFTEEQNKVLSGIHLHLDKPGSKGAFVVAYRNRVPYLVNNIDEIKDDLSERTSALIEFLGTSSFICVPIVYEDESLGVLSVDNDGTKGPPKQSDLNLLMGIAPQIAISINNARTFEKMQASEEKYRDLVESANSIILRINTRGEITFANLFAREFFGYPESDMLGRNILGLIIPEKDLQGRALFPVIREFLLRPEEYVTRETENITRDGERVWVSWSNKAIHDKDGALTEILCVGNDITARKRAEYEKSKLETQLVRAQKMEAIGALAGGVAHDLNNILSGITSYPELLLMELPEDSPMRKSILTIKRSGEKAAAMVQDLLTLARRGVSITNAVDLNTIIRDYFESPEFQKLKEYHPLIDCEISLDDGLKYILGSDIHLGKTLMNLVSNAAEAMPKGGSVVVRTENRYLEKPLKGYDTVAQGEYAVLTVADTGIGISENDLRMIFEPFFSKKVMGRSGTGLGMTVVWSTVKDHNGYINVKSEEGVGTRFELYFPVTRFVVKDKTVKGSLEDYAGSEHILVVDDSEEQREISKNVLKKLGYHVDTARSGEEAVHFLAEHSPDLLILDMIMEPGIDGLETYQKALTLKGRQKALIVSGYSETDRVQKAIRLGVGAYIRKPYSLNDLAKAVRTELDKRID